jgi:tripeptidyl-peptidase-1
MQKLDFFVFFHTVNGTNTTVASESGRSVRSDGHVIHEKRNYLPYNWAKLDKLDNSVILPMRIALAQRNLNAVEKLLMDVSHPQSPNYGRYMTSAKIIDMFAPRQETVSAVIKWLHDFGINTAHIQTSASKGWLSFNLKVAEAEQLLKTKYYVYEHINGQRHYATEEYSVPATIQHQIDFIFPTVHFDVKIIRNPKQSNDLKESSVEHVKSVGTGLANVLKRVDSADSAGSKQASELSSCDTRIIPICLQTLYNFVNYTQKSSKKNNYGIVEYSPQAYVQSDLNLFLTLFNPSAIDTKLIIDLIDDPFLNTTYPGNFMLSGESNLDLQYAVSLVYPTLVTLYQTGDSSGRASFNTFLDAIDSFYCTFEGGDDHSKNLIYPDPSYPDPSNSSGSYKEAENCGKYQPTYVISTSYGYNEADLTPAYEQRQCFEYAKLGLQGVTVLFASGDDGVAGNDGYCIDPQTGEYTNSTAGIKFNPSFPGTCPFITSVGATQINPNSTVYDPESACEQVIYSSGGFSNVFKLPCYQQAAVESFFALHSPPYNSTQYNNSRNVRGYPDISANGANYIVIIGNTSELVYGTSASSPVVGSIVTLINDARLAVNKSSVGFLNPVLYANPDALNDIISGNNPGCGTQGFTAVNGWDPVTGLGTPNFQKLLNVYLNLP